MQDRISRQKEVLDRTSCLLDTICNSLMLALMSEDPTKTIERTTLAVFKSMTLGLVVGAAKIGVRERGAEITNTNIIYEARNVLCRKRFSSDFFAKEIAYLTAYGESPYKVWRRASKDYKARIASGELKEDIELIAKEYEYHYNIVFAELSKVNKPAAHALATHRSYQNVC